MGQQVANSINDAAYDDAAPVLVQLEQPHHARRSVRCICKPLHPDGDFPSITLRAGVNWTVHDLATYLIAHFWIDEENSDQLELSCRGIVLASDYRISDVFMYIWQRLDESMSLRFQIKSTVEEEEILNVDE